MNIYLAGPDVFLPDAIEIGRQKVRICARYGLTGLYPLDNAIERGAADVSLQIFKACEAMMDQCDAIVAHLTPFRGAGADPGTAYELGYMAGRGKCCLAYCNEPALYADRVRRFTTVERRRDGLMVDADGLAVEDFGLNDNLMMIHALALHGAPLVLPRQKPVDIWHDLTAFDVCVAMAAKWRAAACPTS